MMLNRILLLCCTSLLFFSCSDGIIVEGEIKGYDYNGKTVYLYGFSSANLDAPKLLATTTVENGQFSFKGIEKEESVKNEMPTVALLSFFDILDENALVDESDDQLVATFILEKGEIKIRFDNTAVHLSGSPKNDQFGKIHQAITELADFSLALTGPYDLDSIPANEEGKDGRAQFQELNSNLKNLTFDFAKENITNNVGQFLFLNSYGDNMFTPAQMLELIDMSSESFQNSEEIRELKSILDTMKDRYPAQEDDYEYDLSED